ncbi:PP0621 family protein [Pseudomonas sp. EL_65y_Pfl2_R95]|uniref:PP0621 family protein n=1 Tax=Pseudomonas sp. EL_65y_Pfl2_R95 TaxID=3088698 RepID=UPI0030D7CADC
MGLFRLLFLLAIIATAFWLWRRFTQAKHSAKQQAPAKPKPMVRCANCGVHLPREHALENGAQWFCSTAHLRQGPDQGGQ